MQRRKIRMNNAKMRVAVLVLVLCCSTALFAGGNVEKKSEAAEVSDAVKKPAGTGTKTPKWLVEETESSITVIDNGGHEVTIEKPVERIVISGMGVFPTVKAIKADKLVVGTHGLNPRDGRLFFPEMAKLPTLGEGPNSFLDYEKIVSLEPDAVIVLSVLRQDVHENLSGTGISVLQLDFAEEKDIAILGAVLGHRKEAKEYIDWIESVTGRITDRLQNITEDERPSVFLYYGGHFGMAPPPPFGTYGTENLLGNRTIRMAGGRSVSEEVPGEWITVDPEWIIEKDTDFILREYYNVEELEHPPVGYEASGTDYAKGFLDSIVATPAFEVSGAVENDHVYVFEGQLLEFWFIGLQYFAKWFHPDLFSDLDPAEVHQEYLTRFMRIDYDVMKQGVFVFP
jgi:iron complex transport system substrate-binding protein